MYIPKDNTNPSVDLNYWLKSLGTSSFGQTNKNSKKYPKFSHKYIQANWMFNQMKGLFKFIFKPLFGKLLLYKLNIYS